MSTCAETTTLSKLMPMALTLVSALSTMSVSSTARWPSSMGMATLAMSNWVMRRLVAVATSFSPTSGIFFLTCWSSSLRASACDFAMGPMSLAISSKMSCVRVSLTDDGPVGALTGGTGGASRAAGAAGSFLSSLAGGVGGVGVILLLRRGCGGVDGSKGVGGGGEGSAGAK
ncbi:hypothetical protein DFJ73DRAFT_831366 [Zopfochytrium polystomum]|nr:hypothetical protein DFJ73DRAFT_831366 [Zopfochytrium polystomum]